MLVHKISQLIWEMKSDEFYTRNHYWQRCSEFVTREIIQILKENEERRTEQSLGTSRIFSPFKGNDDLTTGE